MKISITNVSILVSLVFIVLKITNIVNYSWIAILSPFILIFGFWSFIVLSLVLGMIGLFMLGVYISAVKQHDHN